MKSIIIIGGGGHCQSVISSVKDQYHIFGIVDSSSKESVLGYKIVGSDKDLTRLFNDGIKYAHVAIGNNFIRSKITLLLETVGFELVNIIDKSAVVCKTAEIGKGVFIGKGAIINANAVIKDGCIINSASVVEHGCVIGAFAHCSPASVVCGNAKIGEHCIIGANSTVIQSLEICDECIIGAGSTVTKSINARGTYVGSPVKLVIRE